MAEIELGNLYDLNKKLVLEHETRLTGLKLQERIEKVVVPYLKGKLKTEKYFMLLCHENRDYTVFSIKEGYEDINKIANTLKLCLNNRGDIYGIDLTEDKMALELWIQSSETQEMSCYYFFPYTDAVIEFGGEK